MADFRLFWIIIFVAACTFQRVQAGDRMSISELLESPTTELINKGNDFLIGKQNIDSALLCYTIVTDRYNSDLSDSEKWLSLRLCTMQEYFRMSISMIMLLLLNRSTVLMPLAVIPEMKDYPDCYLKGLEMYILCVLNCQPLKKWVPNQQIYLFKATCLPERMVTLVAYAETL